MFIANSTLTSIADRNCCTVKEVRQLFANRIPEDHLEEVVDLWISCCTCAHEGAKIDTIIRAYHVVEGDMILLELLIQYARDNTCEQTPDDCLCEAINQFEEIGCEVFYQDTINFLFQ